MENTSLFLCCISYIEKSFIMLTVDGKVPWKSCKNWFSFKV
jgi:hypothetical protein